MLGSIISFSSLFLISYFYECVRRFLQILQMTSFQFDNNSKKSAENNENNEKLE